MPTLFYQHVDVCRSGDLAASAHLAGVRRCWSRRRRRWDASPPSSRIIASVVSALRSSRSTSSTLAPCRANRMEMALPDAHEIAAAGGPGPGDDGDPCLLIRVPCSVVMRYPPFFVCIRIFRINGFSGLCTSILKIPKSGESWFTQSLPATALPPAGPAAWPARPDRRRRRW